MANRDVQRSAEARQPSAGPTRGTSSWSSPSLSESNPFSLMRRMHDEMDRFFSEAFGGFGGASAPARAAGGGLMGWSPAVEVREKDNSLIVCAELPGLDQKDVQVEVTNDALVIQGERKQEHEETHGGFHRSERSYGRFYRAIPLPEHVKTEEAKARFNNGVLEVTIPTTGEQQTKSRRIQIETGSK